MNINRNMSCLATTKTFFSESSVYAASSFVLWWKAYFIGILIILFEISCTLLTYWLDAEVGSILVICILAAFAITFFISVCTQTYVCVNHKSNLFSTQESETLQNLISKNALIKWSGLLLSIIILSALGMVIFSIILLAFTI